MTAETNVGDQEQVLADLNAPIPTGYQIPTGYWVDRLGVLKVTEVQRRDGVERQVTQIASAPCLPVGILRDTEGEELVDLAWRHHGRWEQRPVPRSVAKSGRRLVTVLGDAGFPVMDSSARKMEGWLDLVESCNRERLPVTTIARVLGWQHGTDVFVTGPEQPYQVRPKMANLDHVVDAHHPQGSLEEWQDVVRLTTGYPVAQMAVYASLAAPLLKVLGLPSFTVDLCGQTTTGKTTVVELGLSVWADPQMAITNWNSTRVALEHHLSLRNGLPVVVDETSNAANPEVIRDMLYAIPQGREKARGAIDGTRPTATWHTIALTTGERPIISYTTDGGQSGRVLTLEAFPLGKDNGPLAVAIREGCYNHYGTAGPAFAKALQTLLKDGAEPAEELKAKHRAMAATFAKGSNLQRRRAPLAAALELAASLAAGWGIIPFPVPGDDAWEQLFAYEDSRDDRPGEALAVIRNWTASNPHRIVGLAADDLDAPSMGWAGKLLNDGTTAMNPEVVAEILDKAGYKIDAVKHAWAENGTIRRQGKNLNVRVRVGTSTPRWMVFTPESKPAPADDIPPPDGPLPDDE